MQKFEYQGRDTQGNLIKGQRESSTPDSLANQLTNEEIIPLKINPVEEAISAFDQINQSLFTRKVKTSELMMFSRQMYSLYKAGIPLDLAIGSLAETAQSRVLAFVLRGIRQRLAEGQALGNAMQQQTPRIFPEFVIKLIQVGEVSGKLDETFLQISDFLELQSSTTKKIKSVLRYPIFVICAVTAGIIIINIFVVPNFIAMFKSMKMELPLATRILIASSDFMVNNIWYLLISAVALIFGTIGYVRTSKGERNWGKYQLKLPIFGTILLRIMLARFTRTLTLTMRAGLPITDALLLVSNTLGNAHAKQLVQRMKASVEHGETLTRAAAVSGMFTPLVLQMLRIGEQTGSMDTVLQEVTGFYEREIEYDIQTLSAKIEPLLLLIVAAMVLVLALGVFMPMWDMTKMH